MNATVPWGQDPFLLCSTDSACVSRPRSETTHQGHAKLRKRSRGPTPSKYPCPPVARLQDSATKFDNLCGQQESNCGFQLLELHCYHRAKSVHAVTNPPTEKHTCQTCNKWRNFTRLIYEYESTSLRLVQTLICSSNKDPWLTVHLNPGCPPIAELQYSHEVPNYLLTTVVTYMWLMTPST